MDLLRVDIKEEVNADAHLGLFKVDNKEEVNVEDFLKVEIKEEISDGDNPFPSEEDETNRYYQELFLV